MLVALDTWPAAIRGPSAALGMSDIGLLVVARMLGPMLRAEARVTLAACLTP